MNVIFIFDLSEERQFYKAFINMIYMVVVASKHFISIYFPHKESAKPLGVQVRESTEVEVEVVVSQYRANFPCLSFGSVFSEGIRSATLSTLCGLISRSSPMGPSSLFLLLLPQVMRVVVEEKKQYVRVVRVDVVDWVVT